MTSAARVRAIPLRYGPFGRDRLIEGVLLFGIAYNFVLAIINANVVAISPMWAYGAEGIAYAGCFLIGFRALPRRQMAMVMSGIALVVLVGFLRFAATWQFDPKFLRDAIIPFAFLMLGAAYRGSVPNLVMRIALLVVLLAAFELAFPNVYGDVVDPRSYFVNTRGSVEEDFWNPDSNLYISAIRPGERFWFAADLPRASSFFIEPVTMGNFIIFFAAVALTFSRFLGPLKKLAAFAAIVFLVIASDGRLAGATCVLMLLGAPFMRRIEQSLGALIFLGVLLAGWALVVLTNTTYYNDTMVGRLFVTVQAIGNMPIGTWLGLDAAAPYKYSDSGIAYFISSQSVLVVLAFLVAYSVFMRMRTSDGLMFKNLFIFAFALSLLVSNGYFSVKTAALWWFVCGYLWQRVPARQASPVASTRVSHDEPALGTRSLASGS